MVIMEHIYQRMDFPALFSHITAHVIFIQNMQHLSSIKAGGTWRCPVEVANKTAAIQVV